MKAFFSQRRLGLWVAAVILGADQLSKIWALSALLGGSIPLIEEVLSLTLSLNRGVAFSVFANIPHAWLPYVLAGFSTVVSVLFVMYMPSGSRLSQAGLGCIVGGAIGNMFDRLIFGGVVDFIHVHYQNVWSFPIFNGADMAINLGVGLIVLDAFLGKKNKSIKIKKEKVE